MATNSMDPLAWFRKQVEAVGGDLLREMATTFASALMGAEGEALGGAGYGERGGDRVNSRNGYRGRTWDARAGSGAAAAADHAGAGSGTVSRLRPSGQSSPGPRPSAELGPQLSQAGMRWGQCLTRASMSDSHPIRCCGWRRSLDRNGAPASGRSGGCPGAVGSRARSPSPGSSYPLSVAHN